MPNIPKAQYDILMAEIADYKRELAAERSRRILAEDRETRFDEILNKIVRAANGEPLQGRSGGSSYHVPQIRYGEEHRCTPPTDDEIRQRRLVELQEQAIMLERRLASVVAVSTFAQSHK